jgi:hypothetical protein
VCGDWNDFFVEIIIYLPLAATVTVFDAFLQENCSRARYGSTTNVGAIQGVQGGTTVYIS